MSKIRLDWSKMTNEERKKAWNEKYQELFLKEELDYWRNQLGKNWRAKIKEFLKTKTGKKIRTRILNEKR